MRHNDSTANNGMMVAVVGSMTSAQHARQALSAAAIRAELVKSDTVNGRGCSYGVMFAASQKANVRAILSSAHINVRRYTEEPWSVL